MAKLMDIKGYWNIAYGWNFNDKDMWEGQILLQDDGWFEGIVVDPNSSYKEDRFIFGVYYPEKIIELFKLTPHDISNPFVFHGKRGTKGYDGQFEIIGLFGSTPNGNCHIITRYAETVKQGMDEESQKLEAKIQRYKDNIMDETGKDFYENTIAMRKTMVESVLRNYEGRGFTQEEINKLSEEFKPVNDRVIQSTKEEAKKFIKRMSDTTFDDDDDLPF